MSAGAGGGGGTTRVALATSPGSNARSWSAIEALRWLSSIGAAAAAAAEGAAAAAAAAPMPRSASTASIFAAACVSRSSSLGVISAAPWLCALARSQLRCARISGSYAVRKVCVSAFTLSSSWCAAPPSPWLGLGSGLGLGLG